MIGDRGEDSGLPVEDGHEISAGDVSEKWEHFVTDAIAHEGRVGIAGIEERIDVLGVADGLGLRASEIEDRMTRSRPDRGETIRPGTSQQVHDQRFGPIISGMTERSIASERSMSGSAGTSFEVGSRLHRDRDGTERSTETLGGYSNAIRFLV